MGKDLKLYFITPCDGESEEAILKIVELACQGGVDMIQVRDKEKSDREFLAFASKIKNITETYKVPLLIDDRLDIAKILHCGVHLGQKDIPIYLARKLLGEKAMIGATAKTVKEGIKAEREGANYLGVGAIYPTKSKEDTYVIGLEVLDRICKGVSIPVYAIGGLDKDNMEGVKGLPIGGICVVSAIAKAENPYHASLELKKTLTLLK